MCKRPGTEKPLAPRTQNTNVAGIKHVRTELHHAAYNEIESHDAHLEYDSRALEVSHRGTRRSDHRALCAETG